MSTVMILCLDKARMNTFKFTTSIFFSGIEDEQLYVTLSKHSGKKKHES